MKLMKLISLLGALICSLYSKERPNVIVVLVDDMGYSDLGSFGGEVKTPNLDRLAGNGLRFTQNYNSARCCPSRASLLTGLYSHQAGIANFTGRDSTDRLGPAYLGRLNKQCVTLAEVLKKAGYQTYGVGNGMSGMRHFRQIGDLMNIMAMFADIVPVNGTPKTTKDFLKDVK